MSGREPGAAAGQPGSLRANAPVPTARGSAGPRSGLNPGLGQTLKRQLRRPPSGPRPTCEVRDERDERDERGPFC